MAAAPVDKSKPYFPLAGLANDGWSKDGEATATCFCGAVQLAFATEKPGLANVFLCNCSDCHKITASLFATNFTVLDTHLRHIRGEANLTAFSQNKSINENHTMTNYFCKTCGTLMYRVGSAFPGMKICRVGTVDDFSLHETLLKPEVEQYTKYRVGWLSGLQGVRQAEEMGI